MSFQPWDLHWLHRRTPQRLHAVRCAARRKGDRPNGSFFDPNGSLFLENRSVRASCATVWYVTTNRLPVDALAPPVHPEGEGKNTSWVSMRVSLLLSCLLVMLAGRDLAGAVWPRVGALVVAAVVMGFALIRPTIVGDHDRELRAARALVSLLVLAGLYLTGGALARTVSNTATPLWFAVVLGYLIIGFAGVLPWARRMPHLRWTLIFFLVAHTVLTVALLRSSPVLIDVEVYLHDGVIRLFNGQNPYTMTIPNIYKSPYTEMFYGPHLVVDGRVPVGFPYLPVALLVAIPGYLLGDVRYSQLIAMLVTFLVLRRLASDRVGRAAAVLALASPAAIPVLTHAWVEPSLVALLACLILAVERHRNALVAVFLGLFLASKQYVVLAIPTIWLLQRSVSRRVILIGFGVSAAVIMPFFLVNPAAFLKTTLAAQHPPFRADSISLLVWSVNNFSWPPPWTFGLLPLLGGSLTAIVLAIRAPRTPSAFAGSFGLTLLVTILLSQTAFMNYYFLVSGAFLIGAVACPTPPEPAVLESTIADPIIRLS